MEVECRSTHVLVATLHLNMVEGIVREQLKIQDHVQRKPVQVGSQHLTQIQQLWGDFKKEMERGALKLYGKLFFFIFSPSFFAICFCMVDSIKID